MSETFNREKATEAAKEYYRRYEDGIILTPSEFEALITYVPETVTDAVAYTESVWAKIQIWVLYERIRALIDVSGQNAYTVLESMIVKSQEVTTDTN